MLIFKPNSAEQLQSQLAALKKEVSSSIDVAMLTVAVCLAQVAHRMH
jgi:hypothetical protein